MTFRRSSIIAFAALCAGQVLSAQAIPSAGDTYTSTATPTNNFGAAGTLNIGAGATSFVRFNLAALPAGITSANVTKASLYVWVNKVNAAGGIDVSTAASDWVEGALNQGIAPLPGLASAVAVPVGLAASWVTIDVTNAVRTWVDTPAGNFGFVLAAAAAQPSTNVLLDSRENIATGNGPVLNVTLTLTNGPTGQQGLPGAVGAPGIAGLPGPLGSVGSAGLAGPAGGPGLAGLPGDPGTGGVQGIPGGAGLAGTPGLPGLAGGAGGPGPTGSVGPVGLAGSPGPQGSSGPVGLSGAVGPVGAQGAAGTQTVFGTGTGQAAVLGFEALEHNTAQVLLFAGSKGAGLLATGQTLQSSAYPLLSNLLDGFFGQTGSTFRLPDLRGTAPNKTSYFIITDGRFPN